MADSNLPARCPDLIFKLSDHPTANGRMPDGEAQETMFLFRLADGRRLQLLMGDASRQALEQLLGQMAMDRSVGKLMELSEIRLPVTPREDPAPRRPPRCWTINAHCPNCGAVLPAPIAIMERMDPATEAWRWEVLNVGEDAAHCAACHYRWPVRQLDLTLLQHQ